MSRVIAYHYPAQGGVGLYAEAMLSVYKQVAAVDPHPHGWPDDAPAREIVQAITELNPGIVHFEIGANQASLYRASRELLRAQPQIRQIVTLHDLQTLVAHPSGWQLPPGRSPWLIAQKLIRRVSESTLGQRQLRAWLKHPDIHFITLRPDSIAGATYLPQLTYAARITKHRDEPHAPLECGFLGYWGESKGLTTLLAAWAGMDETAARLTIYGDSFMPGDHFAEHFKAQVAQQPGVSLGGVPEKTKDLVSTIKGLDLIILPYWPENPAGVSAVAMRAAEAGVPVVASRVPQLEEVLGEYATYYEPAKSSDALQSAMQNAMDGYTDVHKKATKLQARLYKERSPEAIGRQLAKIIDRVR